MSILRSKDKDIDFRGGTLDSNNSYEDQESSHQQSIKDDSFEKINIKKYEDPEGMTLEKMKWGFWMIRNKGYFYVLIAGMLVLAIFAGWFVFFFVFGHYVFFGSKTDDMMVRGMLNNTLPNQEFFTGLAARDINFGQSGFLRHGDSFYDFYTQVINVNQNHWTKFDYYFTYGSDRSNTLSGYLLPGETKFVFVLSQDIPRGISGKPQIRIENVNWMRVNPHALKNWRNYATEYMDFNISKKEFIRSQDTNLSDKLSLNELKFTAANNTAYNYHAVDFAIILMNGQEIEGVNKFTADNFRSGMIRDFKFDWPGKFGRITDIYIEPQINIFCRILWIRN